MNDKVNNLSTRRCQQLKNDFLVKFDKKVSFSDHRVANDFAQSCPNFNFIMYADDTTLSSRYSYHFFSHVGLNVIYCMVFVLNIYYYSLLVMSLGLINILYSCSC